MGDTTHIEGRSAKEARRIVEARLRVWDQLATIWDELSDDEQDELLATAKRMAHA